MAGGFFDECRDVMRRTLDGEGYRAVELVALDPRVGCAMVTDAAAVYPPAGGPAVPALDAVLDGLATVAWDHQVVELRRDAAQVVELHLAECDLDVPGGAPVRAAVLAVTCTGPGPGGTCAPLEECLLVAVSRGRDTAVVRAELDEPLRYQQQPRYHPAAYRRLCRVTDRLSGRDGGRRALAAAT